MNSELKLAQHIAAKDVTQGHVACWWLGGSGFVFKTHAGTVVYLDPYLSNSVKDTRMRGRMKATIAPLLKKIATSSYTLLPSKGF